MITQSREVLSLSCSAIFCSKKFYAQNLDFIHKKRIIMKL